MLSYNINPDSGALVLADQLGATEELGISDPTLVEGFTAHGQAWALLGAAGSNSLTLLSVSATGALTVQDHLIDTLGSRFGQVSAVEVVELDGHVFVLAAGGDGGIELLRLLSSGQLLHAARLTGGATEGLQNVTALESFVDADQLHVFVASDMGLNADGEGIAHLVLDRAALGVAVTASGGQLVGTEGDDLLMGNSSATTISGGAGSVLLEGLTELEPGDFLF